MSKQLRVKVNGKSFDVEVSDFSSGTADVKVNGTQYEIEIEEAGGTGTGATLPRSVSRPDPRPSMRTCVTDEAGLGSVST